MEYAKLDENGVVKNIIVADDSYIDSLDDKEMYVKTFSDANGEAEKFYNPASLGGTYDKVNRAFISAAPFKSWVLNDKMIWEAPVKRVKAKDGFFVYWDEEQIKWVEEILEAPYV